MFFQFAYCWYGFIDIIGKGIDRADDFFDDVLTVAGVFASLFRSRSRGTAVIGNASHGKYDLVGRFENCSGFLVLMNQAFAGLVGDR